jgi:predicted nuclease of predicted toxin-antitoxin system
LSTFPAPTRHEVQARRESWSEDRRPDSQSWHDVATVREEGLAGCGDEQLFRICAAENRCLLTLDLDFSDVIRFRPSASAGVAIFRMPKNPTIHLLERMIGRLLDALESGSIAGQLWIVEVTRIRVHSEAE